MCIRDRHRTRKRKRKLAVTSEESSCDRDTESKKSNDVVVSKVSLDNSFIERILDELDLMDELGKKNNVLLDFLCFGYFFDSDSKKIMNMQYLIDQLISCVQYLTNASITSVDEDKANDNMRSQEGPNFLHKATIISNILSFDEWLISESLIKNMNYLNEIWSVLSNVKLETEDSPLLPIFLKVNESLLLSRKDQYLNFIRTRKTLVDEFFKHMNIPVLLDFLLKLIATDKPDYPTGIIELLDDQRVIQKCLKFFKNDQYSADVQACASDFLKALIGISANVPLDEMSVGPNLLSRALASPDVVDHLINIILNENGTALNHTISVVIELIRKNNSDYDEINLLETTTRSHLPSNRDPIYLGYLLKKFSDKIENIFALVDDMADKTIMKRIRINQINQEFQPLGFERIKIVELIAELLHCSNMGLMNSKRAEHIALKRDHLRLQLPHQLQDALQDLEINKTEHSDIISDNNSINNDLTTGSVTDEDEDVLIENVSEHPERSFIDSDSDDDLDTIDVAEIDDSFEIPYINAVSYTHLDVYKRQHHSTFSVISFILITSISFFQFTCISLNFLSFAGFIFIKVYSIILALRREWEWILFVHIHWIIINTT